MNTFWPSDVMTLLSRSSFHLLTASKVVLRVRSNTTKAAAASLKNICNVWRDRGWGPGANTCQQIFAPDRAVTGNIPASCYRTSPAPQCPTAAASLSCPRCS